MGAGHTCSSLRSSPCLTATTSRGRGTSGSEHVPVSPGAELSEAGEACAGGHSTLPTVPCELGRES